MKKVLLFFVLLPALVLSSCDHELPDEESFKDERDGNIYQTVKFGSQLWMAENLAYLPAVSPADVGADSEKHYYVYDYEGTSVDDAKALPNYATYGVLYNREAALSACPAGWHLPSDLEWSVLTDYLEENGYGFEGDGSDIAKSMASTSEWTSSDFEGAPGNARTTNNSSGFSALPGGYRSQYNEFAGLTDYAYFWSSTEANGSYGLLRSIFCGGSMVDRMNGAFKGGFSVRCLRDE